VKRLEVRRACRHCDAETLDPRDVRVGFTCCPDAVEDQLRWRREELDRLRRDAERERDTASPDRFQVRLRSFYVPRADALKAEVARFEAIRDGVDETPVEYPRPYRED
jgi:hypothetical protein